MRQPLGVERRHASIFTHLSRNKNQWLNQASNKQQSFSSAAVSTTCQRRKMHRSEKGPWVGIVMGGLCGQCRVKAELLRPAVSRVHCPFYGRRADYAGGNSNAPVEPDNLRCLLETWHALDECQSKLCKKTYTL